MEITKIAFTRPGREKSENHVVFSARVHWTFKAPQFGSKELSSCIPRPQNGWSENLRAFNFSFELCGYTRASKKGVNSSFSTRFEKK